MTSDSPENPICPPVQDLQQLLFGQLVESEAQALESHLAQCDRCLKTVRTIDAPDPLVDAVRRGFRSGSDLDAEVDPGLIQQLCQLQPGTSPSRTTDDAGVPFAPPEAPNEIGRVGPYRVLKLLGRGGMGVVYLAQHTRLKRLVALKMILAEHASPVRDAHRAAAVPCGDRVGHAGTGAHARAGAARPAPAGRAARSGDDLPEVPGKGAGSALCDRFGTSR